MNDNYYFQPRVKVIGSPVTALPFQSQVNTITSWAAERCSRVVCVANTHMLVEASRNTSFLALLQSADMVTPDGMPLVWMMKLLGLRSQDRVAGMDILLSLCQQSSDKNLSVFFVGSQRKILRRMRNRLQQEFPALQIAGMEPLPFGKFVPEEDEVLIQKINESGAGIVFVSLGCPKQERWMARHKNKINAVMIGLGGVFPIYAGIQRHAPAWMRKAGLEWLHRLLQEPKRLWKRYITTIPKFVVLALWQLFLEFTHSTKQSLNDAHSFKS